MHNRSTLNWLSQGIGTAKVVAQFTDKDIPQLTKLWETTLDGRERDLLKRTLNMLVTKGVAFLEIENVEYYGGASWKFVKDSNVTKDSTLNQPSIQQPKRRARATSYRELI